jgi:hypothetical protein
MSFACRSAILIAGIATNWFILHPMTTGAAHRTRPRAFEDVRR